MGFFGKLLLGIFLVALVFGLSCWYAAEREAQEEERKKAEAEARLKKSRAKMRENELYQKILDVVCQQLSHHISCARKATLGKKEAYRFVVWVRNTCISIYAGRMEQELPYIHGDDDAYEEYSNRFVCKLQHVCCIDFEKEGYAELNAIKTLVDVLREDVAPKVTSCDKVVDEDEKRGDDALIMWDLTRFQPQKEQNLKSW